MTDKKTTKCTLTEALDYGATTAEKNSRDLFLALLKKYFALTVTSLLKLLKTVKNIHQILMHLKATTAKDNSNNNKDSNSKDNNNNKDNNSKFPYSLAHSNSLVTISFSMSLMLMVNKKKWNKVFHYLNKSLI